MWILMYWIPFNLLLVHCDINPPSKWTSWEILLNIVKVMQWQPKCFPAGKNWHDSYSLHTVWNELVLTISVS